MQNKKREQVQFLCMDDMVPQDHLLRIIDKAIDWNFIYDLVAEKYSQDNGRSSMDPVMLIKIPFIQYLYGIRSMWQTCREIEVNVAYRWFLGLDMMDKVPHFSMFGKNYTRRFKDTDLFEQIFSHILIECYKFKLIDSSEVFVDATHVKARANNKKMQKRIAYEEVLFYEELLKKEINEDRKIHGKKPLKEKNDNDVIPPSGSEPKEFTDDIPKDTKTIKCNTTALESGWFHKGEHKNVFAYAIETACDRNGWILGYTINLGNQHDSRAFKGLYDKIKDIVYCYIYPNNKVLIYRTTNRDGYREYKSCGAVCGECPYLSQCTESRDHVKTVTRYIWEPYMEICEDIRQTLGMKDLYAQRKETIERLFGTAKENHGFRYTQIYGKVRMEMKVGLIFACMNLKKLAKIKAKWRLLEERKLHKISILNQIRLIKEKWLWDLNPRAVLSTVWKEEIISSFLYSIKLYIFSKINQSLIML